jgi:undecaprenyl-diphosphatase
MIEYLKLIDQELFLILNGFHNEFFDGIMYWITKQETWYPFYLIAIIWMFWKYGKKAIIPLLLIAVAITLSDQITSGLMKPLFERLRPCHDPQVQERIHTVAGCGGLYGFASGHAANSFALATLLFLFFRQNSNYWILLFLWAGLVAYSRIYVGVHYPGDIVTGGLIGWLIGTGIYGLYTRLPEKYRIEINRRDL